MTEKDNVVNLVEGAERAFVIACLAATGSVTSTKRRYKKFYNKDISGKHVQLIQIKDADKIKARRESLSTEESLKGCAGISQRTRVELLLEVIDAGLEERIVGTYTKYNEETGDKETLPIIKQDLNSVLIALRALKDEQFSREDMDLKKKKANDTGGEEESYDVDDGVA